MKRIVPIALIILGLLLVLGNAAGSRPSANATTADGAVKAFFTKVKAHDWNSALAMVSKDSNVNKNDFISDLNGSSGSLKTLSTLQNVDTKVLRESDSEAQVRADLQWSTAVGAFYETRDLKLEKDGSDWKIYWPETEQANVPPQIIPVTFLRWDVIHANGEQEFGAQNVESPKTRITSMNAIEKDGHVIILGEVENEDTVPGFVSVGATLVGKDGKTVLGEETSFDKMSHTLLPKEISPFRIDFPGVQISQVKSVRMNAGSIATGASADPVIGVLNQRIEKDARGHSVLKGELMNESGQVVNIPHVLATFYDNSGKVIWVSDGYSDRALLPQSPVPFAVDLRDDLAQNVHSYRVTVNQYTRDRT
jgi:hypothetical protein